MTTTAKKAWKNIYERLQKKIKELSKDDRRSTPQLAWQPYQPGKNLRGTDLR